MNSCNIAIMKISDVADRQIPAQPWVDGEKIPWNEPGFSKRMLKEHLSQDHDAASRRTEIVHQQVEYCEQLLGSKTGSRILDLACGPGLHSHELARLGHSTLGIDFSPASIEWAKTIASTESLKSEFFHDDNRKSEFGSGFDLAVLLFGEMNVFSMDDLRLILRKARQALTHNGVLLLEPHVPGVIRANFESEPTWIAHRSGLFSDRPHILLEEGFWHDDVQMAVKRWYLVDSESGGVTTYAQTVVEHAPAKLVNLIESEGFAVRDVAHEDWPTGIKNNDRPAEFYPLVAVAQ
jgi:SAM-dependent methyltransferase